MASTPPPPIPMVTPLPLVPVVSAQFCTPYVVALTVTKKAMSLSGGDFIVTDVNGATLMKVEGRVFSLHQHRVLCDATGAPVLSMRQKNISMHHRWKVYRGDSDYDGDFLFTVKKSHMIQLKTELDVFLAGNTAELRCDFKVKASWLERSCTFYLGDSTTVIALVNRQYELTNVLLGKDTFGLTVYPNVDYAFVVAIIVILDEIHRDLIK